MGGGGAKGLRGVRVVGVRVVCVRVAGVRRVLFGVMALLVRASLVFSSGGV